MRPFRTTPRMIWSTVYYGEDREQRADHAAGRRAGDQAQPQRPGGAGHHGGDERAEQQLALDADVHHPGPRADHAGERAQHDRDGLAERALQQVHHVERGGIRQAPARPQGQEKATRPILR